ncbi:uncharacterized protein LOC118881463 isoform X6 [Balaenoptera musculus]|uniref:Uncharacterized protein LOC118881463 isoform X6 n=1 Tax=Balaenoptera musculus TaxID=9771 RepID=A0A8B8VBU7_BALMU|nr:uncharacterized protein LOC118881463 isoform X6 [Balaenoptera musculus]
MPNLGWWRSWTPARTLRTHCTHTGPGRRPSSSTLCSTSTPPSKMCTCHPPALSGRRHFWIQRDGVCPRPLRCCQRPVSPGGNEVGGSGALPNSTKHLVCAGLALVPLHPLAPLVLSTALKGASKTHTMLRMDAGPGIYLQMLTDLFQAVEETRESTDCSVSMSCLEIYNEVIWDLLKPSSGFLDLREDSRGSIQIAGIAEVSASNTQELRVTGAHGGTCGSSTSATLTSAHRAEPDTQLQSCFRAKGTANFCITSPLSSPVLRADITNGSRTLPSASRCMERVATQGPLTICPLLLLSSDHAAPHQRQLAVHTGVHRHQQDVVPLPRRAAGHRAPAQPRHRHGRGSAHWEALHGGPGGLGAGASDPEPRQEDEGGRPHQPLPAGAGQRHQRAQREGRQPGAVRELPGRKLTRACCRCPSWGSQLALTLATSRHQVKRNLLNVSYHIAQYADVISDLGRQIKHPKAKVEKQEKEKRSIPEADTLQFLEVTAIILKYSFLDLFLRSAVDINVSREPLMCLGGRPAAETGLPHLCNSCRMFHRMSILQSAYPVPSDGHFGAFQSHSLLAHMGAYFSLVDLGLRFLLEQEGEGKFQRRVVVGDDTLSPMGPAEDFRGWWGWKMALL